MSETIYPKGLRTFKPNENAPDFVKGALIVTPSELAQFCEENKQYMSDYKGTSQLRCQILDGNDGIYISVDTWKKDEQQGKPEVDIPAPEDDLPF